MTLSGPGTKRRFVDGISRRGLLFLSLGMLAAWWSFLGYEAITAANPVILSTPQIMTAPIVVGGHFLSNPPRIQVREVLWGDPGLNSKELRLVEVVEHPVGEELRFYPLRPVGNRRYQIQESPSGSLSDAGSARLDYPADDQTRARLIELLKTRPATLEGRHGQ